MVSQRKGEMTTMEHKGDRTVLEFDIPASGTDRTAQPDADCHRGRGHHGPSFKGFEPFKGEFGIKRNGALIAMETGTAIAYSIDKLQDRGKFFIDPGERSMPDR
jgi:GTP-binding protein